MQRAETTLTRIYIHQRKKRTKSGREKNFFCCCWLIYYVTFGFLWTFWYTRNFFRFLFLFESIEKRTCFIYLLWHAYICRVWKVPHQMKIVHFIFLDFCRVFFMCSVWRIFGWCGVLLHLFKGNINHPLWWCLMVFFRIVLFRLVFFQWCFIHSLLTPTHPHCCSIIFINSLFSRFVSTCSCKTASFFLFLLVVSNTYRSITISLLNQLKYSTYQRYKQID